MIIKKNKLWPWCLSVLFGLLMSLGLGLSAWSSTWEPREIVKTYLKAHYPWPEIEILDITGSDDLPKVPPETVRLITGPLGRTVFSFGFRSGEKVIVQAQVRALDWVVATRRPLKQGQLIEKDDIYLSLIDVRRMPKDALCRLEGAWGKVVRRSMEINMPVAENVLGDVPVIKKGQRVTLIISGPGLKITTQGEAREDGHSGRQMKVVNLFSKRDLRGVPVDENSVQVIF
jgi:flagella basal body P-ring formation protein FlgA